MFLVRASKQYKKSIRRILESGKINISEVNKVIDYIAHGAILPVSYRDHQLKGSLADFRECHIRGNLLLIYHHSYVDQTVTLVNIGSHAELFGI